MNNELPQFVTAGNDDWRGIFSAKFWLGTIHRYRVPLGLHNLAFIILKAKATMKGAAVRDFYAAEPCAFVLPVYPL